MEFVKSRRVAGRRPDGDDDLEGWDTVPVTIYSIHFLEEVDIQFHIIHQDSAYVFGTSALLRGVSSIALLFFQDQRKAQLLER